MTVHGAMTMRRLIVAIIIVVGVAGWLCARSAFAQQDGNRQRDQVFEQTVLDRLKQINPEAVPVFEAATRALDSGDLQTARQGFEQVLQLAPGFPDAERRLAQIYLQLDDLTQAELHARKAVAADDASPFNHATLAVVLANSTNRDKVAEALVEAKKGVAGAPDDASTNQALLLAAIYNNDLTSVRQAVNKLLIVAPDYAAGHYFAGLLAAQDERWETAEAELLTAQARGLDAAEVQRVLTEYHISEQANQRRLLNGGIYSVIGWFAAGVVLFAAGTVLSRLTVAAVQRHQRQRQYDVGRGEAIVRGLYRVVITFTVIYFYVSIPVLILLVVGSGAGLVYLFFAVGRIPIQLMAAIGAAVLYTLIAIIRSVFTRVRDVEPGRPLLREEAPDLWAMAERVAQRVGTRPIDAIYITPGTDIAVTERGRLIQKLRGQGQRCLILGLGVLPGMSQGQFEAILAHEYGHFNNRDTAGGNLARQVQVSLMRLVYGLASSGQARFYNPAWLFVNGFYRLFMRITLGASRLQEILADRYAAMAYGVRNFADGLLHVVRQSIVFSWQVNYEVNTALKAARPINDLYSLPAPDEELSRPDIEPKYHAEINRPTSPYDSHPSIKDRLAYVKQLEVVEPVETAPGAMIELLPTLPALQAEMTALVQQNIAG